MGREKGGTLEKDYLFFLNKQSLRRHHDLLKMELDKLKIVFCKTWLTENDPSGLYSIDGYQTTLTKNRVGKKRGGIACFVNFGLKAFSKSFDNRIEKLIITVENDHLRQHFFVLYKTASMNQDSFSLNLDFLLLDVSQIKKEIFFCDDHHVDILVNLSFLVDYKKLLLSSI